MRRASFVKALRGVLRVLAISLPVLLTFMGTVLGAALVLAWLRDTPAGSPETLGLATVCGLIVWLFIAVFHVRQETLTLSFQDRHVFLGKLRSQLKDLGYDARINEADRQVFRPTFQALLLGGKIRLRVEQGSAQLAGPKLSLEIVRKRLRIQNHLENDLRTFWEAKRRREERLLKRVRITMRVSGRQWQSACDQIAGTLAREGAQVVCEVSVVAQNEAGISDQRVEELIRASLAREDIQAVIHKERFRPVPSAPASVSDPPPRAACLAGAVE
jgi:hypothetical protein